MSEAIYTVHPDLSVTLCPHRAKMKSSLHPSRHQSLALEHVQRRLSGTSSSVLITTAICIVYANILYKPALSLVRLFSLKFFTSNNQTTAIGDLRPVKDSD